MGTPIVYTLLRHSGKKYYRCLKGNGNGGCKKSVEITEEIYNHLIKYDNAINLHQR